VLWVSFQARLRPPDRRSRRAAPRRARPWPDDHAPLAQPRACCTLAVEPQFLEPEPRHVAVFPLNGHTVVPVDLDVRGLGTAERGHAAGQPSARLPLARASPSMISVWYRNDAPTRSITSVSRPLERAEA
jgi:hypothetical protein